MSFKNFEEYSEAIKSISDEDLNNYKAYLEKENNKNLENNDDKNNILKKINFDFSYEFALKISCNNRYSEEKRKKLEDYLSNDKKISSMEKYIIYKELGCLDPDDKSDMLQKIYKKLWDNKYLERCKKDDNSVWSDTMTSAQYLISHFYETTFSDEWQSYKDKYNKKQQSCTPEAMRKIMNDIKKFPNFKNIFISEEKEYSEQIKYNDLREFIKSYHTIGNYIPVPKGFNTARSGNYADHDMWDLTLIKIKEYYEKDKTDFGESNEVLTKLLFCEEMVTTKNWLDSFGKGKDGWNNFIQKNYLQDYIDEEKTGLPIKEKFTQIHDWEHPVPTDYNAYFKLLTKTIKLRSIRMIKELKNELAKNEKQ